MPSAAWWFAIIIKNGRTDVSEIISAAATYHLTNWCSISAISSFAHSDSNQDVFDYNVANVGARSRSLRNFRRRNED